MKHFEACRIWGLFCLVYFGLALKCFQPFKLSKKQWLVILTNTMLIFPILTFWGLRFLRIVETAHARDGWKLLFAAICFEIAFYCLHRLSHKLCYRNFHSWHHSISAQCGLTGLYAHPIDFIFCNFFPGVLGLLLLKEVPRWVLYTWVVSAASYVVVSHQIPNFHLLHHTYFRKNYGTFGVMDKLCGTSWE